MNRGDFLCGLAGAAIMAAGGRGRAAVAPRAWKAAVIGHTGRGNFGHNLDLIFNDRPGIEVVAVADPNPAGRVKARERCQARRSYADYQAMLEKERPQLVSVAPRMTDQHHAMVSAALAVGAHVYCEKPFTRTLAEADDLIALAQRAGRKIAVAHQGRNAPATLLLKRRFDEGVIGDLLEIRAHGKQDKRAGGEDMVVLGTHTFDLMRFFAGDPEWASARILQGGREVTPADIHPATEEIGPIVGDEIEAWFAFPRGVSGRFTSRAKNAVASGPWGMELIGTKGRLRLLNDVHTQAFIAREGASAERGDTREWLPLDPRGGAFAGVTDLTNIAANRRVVDDWLDAIERDREPVCSGWAAMKSLELIHAVFAAGMSRGRVALPLVARSHPLEAARG